MSPKPFEYRFSIRLHDTDAAGVLFFAHLLRHAHDAYEAFMEQAGFGLVGLIAGMPVILGSAAYGWLSVSVLLPLSQAPVMLPMFAKASASSAKVAGVMVIVAPLMLALSLSSTVTPPSTALAPDPVS